jgi:mRNA interferase YafQ
MSEYSVVYENRLKKDMRLAIKRGLDISKFSEVVKKLASGNKLDPVYRDHKLLGKYSGFRECHINPDWLMVYQLQKSQNLLVLVRIGTHSDLYF